MFFTCLAVASAGVYDTGYYQQPAAYQQQQPAYQYQHQQPAYHQQAAYHQQPLVKAAVALPVKKIVHQEEAYAPAHYAFEYSVHDEHTGDIKSQQEKREGDHVQGSYTMIDADGFRRTVEYTADDHNGFQAVVHREPLGHGHVQVPVAHKVAVPVAHKYAAPAVHNYVAPTQVPVYKPNYVAPAPIYNQKYVAPVQKYAAPIASHSYVQPAVQKYVAPVQSYKALAPVQYKAPAPFTQNYYQPAPVQKVAAHDAHNHVSFQSGPINYNY